jgi:acetamidase/formamidase
MPARTLHDVPRDAYNYVWDHAIPPAVEVGDGDEVQLFLRDASDDQIHADSDASDIAKLDFDHVNPVSGPIYVKGARAGDVLAVEILEFSMPEWGWTAIIPGFGLLADEFPDPWLRISRIDADTRRVRFGDGISLPLAPFTGTIGVAPGEPGPHPVLPPSRSGGNIDTRHVVAGTTLLLPVGAEGGLLSAGDSHAAQGDGEVCGTAIESRMDVTVRVSVRRDLTLQAPGLEIPPPKATAAIERGGWDVLTGVGPDLMEASKDAVRAAITFLGERRGLDRQTAYALCSVAADLRIHEIVDAPNWVVGCWVPRAVFEES